MGRVANDLSRLRKLPSTEPVASDHICMCVAADTGTGRTSARDPSGPG